MTRKGINLTPLADAQTRSLGPEARSRTLRTGTMIRSRRLSGSSPYSAGSQSVEADMCRLAVAVVFVGAFLTPTFASAQASISGVVRDTSGAVLPGVTIEAS